MDTTSNKLLQNKYGALTTAERNYALLQKALAYHWSGERREAFNTLRQIFKPYRGTFTEARAMFMAGNIAITSADNELEREGKKVWWHLIKAKNRNCFVEKAWVSLARRLEHEGHKVKALRLYRAFPFKDGSYTDIVRERLRQLRLSLHSRGKNRDDEKQ